MRLHRWASRSIDLADVSPDVRRVLEAVIAGDDVELRQNGETLGTLDFTPAVHTGVVHHVVAEEDRPKPTFRDGVKVMATTMPLSREARQRLGEAMGSDYVVVDLRDAPETTDVVLTHPGSPQLLGILRGMFPDAHIIASEIDDPELGIELSGPVGRVLGAGAQAYLPPRPVHELAENVRAYVDTVENRQLRAGSSAPVAGILTASADDGERAPRRLA